MEDLIGVYGILDRDHWPEAPFQLLDGGVEIRWKEPYAFHNAERGTYSGWLMQYTLSGTGWFEKNGKTYEMSPGRGFLCPSARGAASGAETDAFFCPRSDAADGYGLCIRAGN